MCYVAGMRDPLKPEDASVLAAWLLWEMFCGDDDGVRDTRARDDGRAGKPGPQPPPVSSES
jgi:hypothetical protein